MSPRVRILLKSLSCKWQAVLLACAESRNRFPMKIEFRCDQCDRLLRVAPIHAGSAVACPACRMELMVPDLDSAWEDDSVVGRAGAESVWDPQTVSLQSILHDTWTLYIENLWLLLAVALIDVLLWIIGIVLIFIPAVGTFAVLLKAIGLAPPLSVVGMFIVWGLGFMYLMNAMTCSQAKFFLKIARGEPTTIFDAFHVGWGHGAITMLPTIFCVICMFGLVTFIVPGVFVYLFFWPYIWIWADQQTGGQDSRAFVLAKDLSQRNLATSVAISAISILMTIFGFKLFGQSWNGVLKAVAYLKMSGQEITGIVRRTPEPILPFEGVDPA